MELHKVTMGLSADSLAAVNELNEILGCQTKADSVARAVRVALILAKAWAAGEPVVITRSDGREEELVLVEGRPSIGQGFPEEGHE